VSVSPIRAASGVGGTDNIPRLKEGVERFMITDINNPAGGAMAQSTLPIMWDFVDDDDDFSHSPGGANVLYMDGHVAWSRYPSDQIPTSVFNGVFGRNF
jgi:prepilin-type processing-associated H-X9-DG protein